MGKLRAKIDYLLKHSIFLSKLFRFFGSLFFNFIGIFIKIEKHSVLFSAHNRAFNDSPKTIYLEMIGMPAFSNFKYYWAVEDLSTIIPGNCIKVKADSFKYFIVSLKCKYWITCVNIERSLRYKKRKQVYLNTGHGITIKTCGNDAKGRKDYNFKHVNYFCISSEYERNIYINAFKLKPNCIIPTGLPRNEELFSCGRDEVLHLKKKLNIPLNKKVVLYAPTWRDSNDGGKSYSIAPPIDLEKWRRLLENEYIVLFRSHPYTNKQLNIVYDDCIRDYSSYDNVNDLLKISDYLISDYSAIIFDFAILEKPIICFAYDYEKYKQERGLELDLKTEMPNGIVENEDALLDLIIHGNYTSLSEKTKEFKEKYISYGKNATLECIKTMFKEYF